MQKLFSGRTDSRLLHSGDTAHLHVASLYWVRKIGLGGTEKLLFRKTERRA